jgi:hypothetical protein
MDIDMDELLDCGHHAIKQGGQSVWVTVFYPNKAFPYRRFCDCMIQWHEWMRDEITRQIREEQRQMLEEQERGMN